MEFSNELLSMNFMRKKIAKNDSNFTGDEDNNWSFQAEIKEKIEDFVDDSTEDFDKKRPKKVLDYILERSSFDKEKRKKGGEGDDDNSKIVEKTEERTCKINRFQMKNRSKNSWKKSSFGNKK